MPYRFTCRECKEFIYIREVLDNWTNYPCSNCDMDNYFTKKQSIKFFFMEEIDEATFILKAKNIQNDNCCPQCGEEQNKNAFYCKDCGAELYPKKLIEIKYCDKCESQYETTYKYCEKDGNQLVLMEIEIDESPKKIKSTLTEKSDLPMKWYSFITYLLFPVVVIGYILGALMINDDTVIVTFLVAAVFGAIIVYGLHNKTSWSWKFLILSYLLNSATFRIDRLEDVGLGVYIFGIIIINAIVTYPHYIYFNKRKHLFVN